MEEKELKKENIDLGKKVDQLQKEKKRLSIKLATEKTKKSVNHFRTEFRKSLSTAIVAAFGIIIALVWKDVITAYVNEVTNFSPVQGELIKALIITFIGVLGVMFFTKLLSNEKNK